VSTTATAPNRATGRLVPAPLLGVVVGLLQVTGTYFAAREQVDRESLDALAYVLLVVGPLALIGRRRYPVGVLVLSGAAVLGYLAFGYPYGPIFLGLVVAFYSAVTNGHARAAWISAGAFYVGYLLVTYPLSSRTGPPIAHALGVAGWLLAVLVVSEVALARSERLAEHQRVVTEAERRRAGEERLRIAQELHDSLAHHLSLINVQAGTALHLLDERPQQTRPALGAIKQASKEALDELRSVLDMLREPDGAAPRTPTPGLDRVDDLVERAELAGLDVTTTVTGATRALPVNVDRAAFRIVQEALTNVTRHAGPARVSVRLDYGARDLTIVVEDDGPGGRGGGWGVGRGEVGSGAGITGMRERAGALGGRLDAGPRPSGGFEVRARLPIPA